MRLDGVVEIDESSQLELAVGIDLKPGLVVPHLHQGADKAVGLAVGLGLVNLGELLADAVGLAGLEEGVAVGALILFAVV